MTLQTLALVWSKGAVATGYNPDFVRRDACGALIEWKEYGNRNSSYGWEVDHSIPVARGGADTLSNWYPLNWQNNARKSDGALVCAVTA